MNAPIVHNPAKEPAEYDPGVTLAKPIGRPPQKCLRVRNGRALWYRYNVRDDRRVLAVAETPRGPYAVDVYPADPGLVPPLVRRWTVEVCAPDGIASWRVHHGTQEAAFLAGLDAVLDHLGADAEAIPGPFDDEVPS